MGWVELLKLILQNAPQLIAAIHALVQRRIAQGQQHKIKEDANAMAEAFKKNDMAEFNRIFNS